MNISFVSFFPSFFFSIVFSQQQNVVGRCWSSPLKKYKTLALQYYELFLEEKHIRLINQGHTTPSEELSLMEIIVHAFQTACGLLQSVHNNTILHGKILNVIVCRPDLVHICWEGGSFGLAIFAAFVSFALGGPLPRNAIFTGGVMSDSLGIFPISFPHKI